MDESKKKKNTTNRNRICTTEKREKKIFGKKGGKWLENGGLFAVNTVNSLAGQWTQIQNELMIIIDNKGRNNEQVVRFANYHQFNFLCSAFVYLLTSQLTWLDYLTWQQQQQKKKKKEYVELWLALISS